MCRCFRDGEKARAHYESNEEGRPFCYTSFPQRTPLRVVEGEGRHNSEALASPTLIALLLLHLLQFLSPSLSLSPVTLELNEAAAVPEIALICILA